MDPTDRPLEYFRFRENYRDYQLIHNLTSAFHSLNELIENSASDPCY